MYSEPKGPLKAMENCVVALLCLHDLSKFLEVLWVYTPIAVLHKTGKL